MANNVDYKGITFRQRYDRNWAEFMDRLGIKWEYNTCDDGYIPDFYLPEKDMYLDMADDGFDEDGAMEFIRNFDATILLAACGPYTSILNDVGYRLERDDYSITDLASSHMRNADIHELWAMMNPRVAEVE